MAGRFTGHWPVPQSWAASGLIFLKPDTIPSMHDYHSNVAPSPSSLAAFVICAKCGASNPAVSEFCRQCGDAGVKPSMITTQRRRSSVLVAMCASVVTAIPLIVAHFAIMSHRNRLHNEALRRNSAEVNLNLGKTQIALSAGKSSLRDAEAERKRDIAEVNQSVQLTKLQAENARLQADAQRSAQRIKTAEDKFEEADRQLRIANGTLRELREELDARNEQQARTMKKLTETESRLRSAEARNSRNGGYRP